MAYTTFTFYENTYHGNVVPAEDFDRIADRASDFLDVITFDRLVGGLPDDERGKTKVQKAVCAVCDKLYYLELADIQALSAAAGGISSGSAGGTGGVNAGVITSRSAGSESISYASPSENRQFLQSLSTLSTSCCSLYIFYPSLAVFFFGGVKPMSLCFRVCLSSVGKVFHCVCLAAILADKHFLLALFSPRATG